MLDKQGNQISSDGKLVFYHQVSPTDVIGYADVDGSGTFNAATDRVVFELTNVSGTFTFNLNDQIDHNTADATGTGDAKVLALT